MVEASGKHSSKCVPDYNIYTAYSGNLSPDETNSLFQRTADSDANFVSGFLAHETLAQIQKFDPTFSRPVLNVSESKMHCLNIRNGVLSGSKQSERGHRHTWERRAVLNGILWVMRTGTPWADVPEKYPSSQTCPRPFQQWVRSGVMKGITEALVLISKPSPGGSSTNLQFNRDSRGLQLTTVLVLPVMQSAAAGAVPTLCAATAPDAKPAGCMAPHRSSVYAS